MQLALGVARQAERFEQGRRTAGDFFRDQLADADHLEAVIGVGDQVAVLMENVEDGETVRGETADAAGGLLRGRRRC